MDRPGNTPAPHVTSGDKGSAAADDRRVEFEALRREIERRSTTQHALVVLNLAAVAAVTTAALKPQGREAATVESPRTFFLLSLIPFVSFALARLWLDNDSAIGRIGSYIRTCVERPGRGFGWEAFSANARMQEKARLFAAAFAAIFVAPGVLALVAIALAADGFLEWTMVASGIALTFANGYGWWRRPGEWKRRDSDTGESAVCGPTEPGAAGAA